MNYDKVKFAMKNKLFFCCIFTYLIVTITPKFHATQEQPVLDELSADLFTSILDNCSPIDASQLAPLRNAHSIEQNESMLQKIQMFCIRWYAHALCRYHLIKKWISARTQQKKTSNS